MGHCCCRSLLSDEEIFEEHFPGYREKKLLIRAIVNQRKIVWEGGEDKFVKMCMWCHLPKEHPSKVKLNKTLYPYFRRQDLRMIKELVKPEDQRKPYRKKFILRKRKHFPGFNFLSSHS